MPTRRCAERPVASAATLAGKSRGFGPSAGSPPRRTAKAIRSTATGRFACETRAGAAIAPGGRTRVGRPGVSHAKRRARRRSVRKDGFLRQERRSPAGASARPARPVSHAKRFSSRAPLILPPPAPCPLGSSRFPMRSSGRDRSPPAGAPRPRARPWATRSRAAACRAGRMGSRSGSRRCACACVGRAPGFALARPCTAPPRTAGARRSRRAVPRRRARTP